MKRLSILTTTLLASLLVFGSCSKDEGERQRWNDYLTFNASMKGYEASRASGTDWDRADEIGIYMYNGATLSDATVEAANLRYTTPGDGEFSPATASDRIEIPESGTYNFIAYYPYTTPITDYKVQVDVSNQAEQEKFDLIYAVNTTGATSATQSVDLEFNHMLSKLKFNITDASGFPLTGTTVVLKGFPTKSEFSLADAIFSDDAASVADITAVTTVNGSTAVGEAIVVPTTDASSRSVVFTTSSYTYTYNFEAGRDLESSKEYEFTVKLSPDGSVTVGGDINDWTTVPGASGDIDLEPDGGVTPNPGEYYGAGTLASWTVTEAGSETEPFVQNGAGVFSTNATLTVVGFTTIKYEYTASNGTVRHADWMDNMTSKYWLFTLPLEKEIEAGTTFKADFNSYGTNTGPKEWTMEYSTDNSSWTEMATYDITGTTSTPYSETYVFGADVTGTELLVRLRPRSTETVNGSAATASGNNRLSVIVLSLQ